MKDGLRVINVGLADFTEIFRKNKIPYEDVDWKPPAQGDPEVTSLLFRLCTEFLNSNGKSRIEAANRSAITRILAARPVLRRVRPARELFPGLGKETLLHAGPPVKWAGMCEPMQGALIGALKYEGLADSDAEAAAMLASGKIDCRPTHQFGAAAPMAGVISASMPLFEVENTAFGTVAYAPLNEGVGSVLRFGANSPSVIAHLKWLEEVLGPALDRTVSLMGGVELKHIITQALLMGDELHQRNTAAGLLFHRQIARALADGSRDTGELAQIVSFLTGTNEQFFLNLAMAAAKSALDAAVDIPCCSLITAMSRNGTDFGLMVSGLGSRWITAPSLLPRGLYFPGFAEEDANPDMGDSAVIECYGLGGFAMAAAPTVARFVGAADLNESLGFTFDMQHICAGSNPDFSIPALNFAGVPLGIDIIRSVSTGILPVINSGVAHRHMGIGQVGAGIATPPMAAMVKALILFYEHLKNGGGAADG